MVELTALSSRKVEQLQHFKRLCFTWTVHATRFLRNGKKYYI